MDRGVFLMNELGKIKQIMKKINSKKEIKHIGNPTKYIDRFGERIFTGDIILETMDEDMGLFYGFCAYVTDDGETLIELTGTETNCKVLADHGFINSDSRIIGNIKDDEYIINEIKKHHKRMKKYKHKPVYMMMQDCDI